MSDIILQNLLSPVVLFFVLGIIAAIFKSDLKFPSGLSEGLSIYLLIAIGVKGGIELSHYSIDEVFAPILGALFLGVVIPLFTIFILKWMKLDTKNAIALAATYGSISIVTYGAAISFLAEVGTPYEGYMNALVVLMESPAILVSLLLLNIIENKKEVLTVSSQRMGIVPSSMKLIDKEILRESIFGKSILLLLGSLFIGLFLGESAVPMVKPLFMDLYNSVLILFLLNMGLIAGQRLPEVKKHGVKLLLFGLCTPLLYGTLGVLVGNVVGLSVGGAALMGVLAGSASYIAAPAALKSSVPEANPSIYLGLALGVTFPFNLIIGIPVYFEIAKWIQ
ncbi:sodium-dependent bicarbonate transport family permease [Aquibacillus koreensis]|uniref:Sodium-dependent bicarbonate transport family permease n=1 Tax=Aquibacillus koreensis TaxID=279446 RepID=A0A9X4AHS7_9BACI|nr:sodium-dependent bicarbonate transport family permease [Aquibacillus koreensis]MCT2535811.1 sodium-dependent bicarbonate transport family permease [Aquibacillus koreensis]MDC3420266.1 sodium-dependent bicarbonate transport family permease [Aquibacillus koreensis]